MTFEELLKSVGTGKMPRVEAKIPIKHATTNKGTVVVIKDNGNFRGCAVLFDGMKWDTWFNDLDDADKRSHYMNELEFCE